MGYKRAGFAFHGRGYAEQDAVKRWLAGDVIQRVLLAPLERGGYLGRVSRVSRNLGEPEPLESLDDLRARAATWGHEVVSLFAGDRHYPDWEIFFGLDNDTRFANLRVVIVDAIDMRSETPAAVGTNRQLYLGASDGHCWSVTSDAGRVCGFFIAERG